MIIPPPQRTGKQLIEALDQTQAAVPVSFCPPGALSRQPGPLRYVQAIAWIGACLADGLAVRP